MSFHLSGLQTLLLMKITNNPQANEWSDEMTEQKQPIYKFGDKVQILGEDSSRVVKEIYFADDVYYYVFWKNHKQDKIAPESQIKPYTPPPRTYSFTKRQLAEAWDNELLSNDRKAKFEHFCKHLGVGDEF